VFDSYGKANTYLLALIAVRLPLLSWPFHSSNLRTSSTVKIELTGYHYFILY